MGKGGKHRVESEHVVAGRRGWLRSRGSAHEHEAACLRLSPLPCRVRLGCVGVRRGLLLLAKSIKSQKTISGEGPSPWAGNGCRM